MKKFQKIFLIFTVLVAVWLVPLGFTKTVRAASAHDLIRVSIEIKEKFYRVIITVLDEEGSPIKGAKVILDLIEAQTADGKKVLGVQTPPSLTRFTDEKGKAVFDNLVRGEYQVTIEHDGKIGKQKIVVGVGGAERVGEGVDHSVAEAEKTETSEAETIEFILHLEPTKSPISSLTQRNVLLTIGALVLIIGFLLVFRIGKRG